MLPIEEVLPLVDQLSKDRPPSKIPGVMHLYEKVLHVASEEEQVLLFQAADEFVKSAAKQGPFHCSSFY